MVLILNINIFMMQIFKDFFNSSPLQKLSTVSDIATILGISVATLVAGPFLSDVAGLGFNLVEFLWAIFFYSLFATIVLAVSTYLLSSIKTRFTSKKYLSFSVLSFLLLFFISIAFSTATGMKEFFGGVTSNRYMLPFEPKQSVIKVEVQEINTIENLTTITGKVSFKNNVDFNKYLIVAYSSNLKDGEFEYMKHGSYKYSAKFNASGEFTFLKLDTERKKDIYLVIYRKADYQRNFPSNLTQIPSNEMDLVGAKVYHVSLNG